MNGEKKLHTQLGISLTTTYHAQAVFSMLKVGFKTTPPNLYSLDSCRGSTAAFYRGIYIL